VRVPALKDLGAMWSAVKGLSGDPGCPHRAQRGDALMVAAEIFGQSPPYHGRGACRVAMYAVHD